jgi:hypothetical protein
MKKLLISVLASLICGLLIIRCESENETIKGKIISSSDCKGFKSASSGVIQDTLSCIYYKFEETTNKLSLTHVNAGFNCCPGELSCTVALNGDTIIIRESEESSLCDCDCLYDLEIEVSGIIAGTYHIKIIEPYCGDQEKLIFQVSFPEEPEGSRCATRKQYPWGMGY